MTAMKKAADALSPPPAVASGLAALGPEQAARLECLRIAVTPQLMRDAGMAINFAAKLEAFVMNGAEKSETGGQGSQPPA